MSSPHLGRPLMRPAGRWLLVLCIAGLLRAPLCAQNEPEEEEQPWNVAVATRYLSRFTRMGVDLSRDQPAIIAEGSLTHALGFTVGADAAYMLGSDAGYEQSSFHIGYERSLSGLLSLAGTYAYHDYSSDTLNTLAGLANTLTVGAALHFSPVTISASYNVYFGSGTANFIAVGASSHHALGQLTLEPEMQLTFVSQTVDATLLPQNRGNGKGQGKGLAKQQGSATTTTSTITGMSSLTIQIAAGCPIGKGFVVSLTPAYVYSPTDLAARTSQFLWSAALAYSVDF